MPSTRVPPLDPTREKTRWEAFGEKLLQYRPVTWFLLTVGERIDPFLMRISGGRINSTGTEAVVVLTHVGRKSGKVYRTPLAYFTDGDDVILMGSKGGAREHPAWIHNLRHDPNIELHVGPNGGPYVAREAEGAERERLWKLANQLYEGYDGYQELAGDRVIPVVVCSPAS